MRTQGSLVLCCCWTLLDSLLTAYMIPVVVSSIYATHSSSSSSVYATHSSSSSSVYAAHSRSRGNDYAAHSGGRGNDYAAHTSGRNIADTSRRESLFALFTEPAICTAKAPISVPVTARKPPPLCQSAWYRDLLQGVCQHGGGAQPPALPFPIRKEPEQASEEEDDLVAVAAASESAATTAVEKEWTKNFASPECGAKLGTEQLSLRPANILSEFITHTYFVY
jgi:hypothetical protein